MDYDDDNDTDFDDKVDKSHLWKKGVSGNPNGRPKKNKSVESPAIITDEDREYFGYDSKKFLERALLKATTWEEGLKYAKELRMLQHPSLQSIQTRTDTTHTLTLRWSTEEELPSNQKVIEHDDNYEAEEERETT